MTQRCLNFDAPVITGTHAEQQARLGGQCLAIVERLKQGPATNDELSVISRKYTSRISDLRKMNYDVQLVSHYRATGLTVYELKQ